jgi:hypothetical protein
MRPAEPKPAPKAAAPSYGIENAIKLMRSLPVDPNNELLVVRVVKGTLESMNMRLPVIIEDATRKETVTQERIGALTNEVAGLEQEIAKRKQEIKGLEEDLAETSKVKKQLQLAEGSTAPASVRPQPAATPAPKPAAPGAPPGNPPPNPTS